MQQSVINSGYVNTLDQQLKYELEKRFQKHHEINQFIVVDDAPMFAYYALKLKSKFNNYEQGHRNRLLVGDDIKVPLLNMRTLQLKICSMDEVSRVCEQIPNEQRNFSVYNIRRERGIAINDDSYNRTFEAMVPGVRVHGGEYISLWMNNMDLTFWSVYDTIHCNKKAIAHVSDMPQTERRLWVAQYTPIKMVYQALPGILVMRLNFEIRHNNINSEHTTPYPVTVVLNMMTDEVMWLGTTNKDYPLKDSPFDNDNKRLLNILMRNVKFNAVLTDKIYD